MKFSTVNHNESNIEFSTEIDEDGDFMVFANGHKLLFISSSGGALHRMGVPGRHRDELAGLKFGADGRIEV